MFRQVRLICFEEVRFGFGLVLTLAKCEYASCNAYCAALSLWKLLIYRSIFTTFSGQLGYNFAAVVWQLICALILISTYAAVDLEGFFLRSRFACFGETLVIFHCLNYTIRCGAHSCVNGARQ